MNEDDYHPAFCVSVGGQTDTRRTHHEPGGQGDVTGNGETSEPVDAGGRDRVRPARFFADLTGKRPAVVMYDTDGKVERGWALSILTRIAPRPIPRGRLY